MNALINRDFLRYCSYTHSVVYSVLLWAAISLLCLEAVRRRVIPTWLGVMVAVVGGIGPFAGSIGFYLEERKIRDQGRAPRPAAEKVS